MSQVPPVLVTEIIKMRPDTNCRNLTDDYRNCKPPFRYHNSQTKQVRDCNKECYNNAAAWLMPLLQSMPTKVQVHRSDGTSKLVNYDLPEEPYFVVTNLPKQREILVQMQNNKKYDREYEMKLSRNIKGTYFPESVKATAETVQELLRPYRTGSDVDIVIKRDEFLDYQLNGDETFTFPGNDVWNRFAKFCKPDPFYHIQLLLKLRY